MLKYLEIDYFYFIGVLKKKSTLEQLAMLCSNVEIMFYCLLYLHLAWRILYLFQSYVVILHSFSKLEFNECI